MIDDKLVDNIRAYGTYKDSGEGRWEVLTKDIGFRVGEKAEYVIITGCLQPEGMPHVFRALKELLDQLKVDYTLLSKEYCCSWMPLGQPAVIARDEDSINAVKQLSREFITENFKQAKTLGAKAIVLFCAACEPNYANCSDATDLDIISYSELIDRYFSGGKLNLDVDYYPGCYRFRRRVTTKPLDIEPALRVLSKIEGLRVNHLDSKLCCFVQPHLEQLTSSIMTKTMITICTGCYYNLRSKLHENGNCQVKMLPEVVLESIRDK